jgi:hypothetical protein
VIYQQYSGDVSFEDMQDGHHAIMNLLNSSHIGKQRIHIIFDLSQRKTLAADTMKLKNMREMFSYKDNRFPMGWFLVIQPKPHPVMRFVALASAKTTNLKLRIVPSVENAQTFLKRVDTSLLNDVELV